MKNLKFLLLLFISFQLNLTAQNSYEVAFDIPAKCHRIGGKSFRCCGDVSVYRDGRVQSIIKISSNRYQGFTGGMIIKFYDKQKRVIYQISTPSWGVNGKSSKTVNWSTHIPKEVLEITRWAGVHGVHNSSNRTLKKYTKEGEKLLRQYLASQMASN